MSLFLRTIKHQEKADREAFMIRNGKRLLEKLIASCNGKYNPIRSYSAEELKRATNDYQYIITDRFHFKLCQGLLQDRPISVMKFDDNFCKSAYEYCFNNIAFASQISHKNVLKLIGCCLEAQIPVLVFEPVEYGTLSGLLHTNWVPSRCGVESLQLKHRLKIAMEIANVNAYLHIGFSRPIVFRDLTSSNILFCEQYVPKLFDFSLSVSIPEGETHIHDAVRGSSDMFAPEYVSTGYFNEKTDVYNFGLLLYQIVTGEKIFAISDSVVSCMDFATYIENHGCNGIADLRVIRDELLETWMRASTDLALKCCSRPAEDRPTMINVAKQLRQIYQSI